MSVMVLKAGSGADGGSFRHPQAFCSGETLQLTGVIRVAGEEEHLVIFREGSDGLDGGGAAGAVHVGEGGGEGDDFEWLILNFEWQREM
jgi:hypothetical protein